MRTAQEQQLINKIAHAAHKLTPQEIQAITPEILNSKINDGSDKSVNDDSDKSEWSVAFALACSSARAILAANNHALGSKINAETLNAIVQQGYYAGQSLAFVLAQSLEGAEILAANNNMLGRMINAGTLNTVIKQEPYAGRSVAYELALFPEGLAILAANNNTLGLKINAEALNVIVQLGREDSLAVELAESAEGHAILAANNYALALQISEKTLYAVIGYSGVPVVGALEQTPEGRKISSVIKERHKNNNVMLALYSSKVDRLGKRSKLRVLQNELLGNVLIMLDGRTPQKLNLK